MFIINDKNNKMILTKGDNATFQVKLADLNGKEVKKTGTFVFTLRENPDSATYKITKTCTDGKFAIIPSDTSSLTAGLYCYDVQFTDNDNNVSTVIPNSFFELRQEITR